MAITSRSRVPVSLCTSNRSTPRLPAAPRVPLRQSCRQGRPRSDPPSRASVISPCVDLVFIGDGGSVSEQRGIRLVHLLDQADPRLRPHLEELLPHRILRTETLLDCRHVQSSSV